MQADSIRMKLFTWVNGFMLNNFLTFKIYNLYAFLLFLIYMLLLLICDLESENGH